MMMNPFLGKFITIFLVGSRGQMSNVEEEKRILALKMIEGSWINRPCWWQPGSWWSFLSIIVGEGQGGQKL